jgi:hypothetical protein
LLITYSWSTKLKRPHVGSPQVIVSIAWVQK